MAEALAQNGQTIETPLLENACVHMLWTFARQGLLQDAGA